jgi:hypothetical protein
MLSCSSYQCVQSLKTVGTFDLHLPIFLRTRSNNRHSPPARPVAQNVFNDRLHFPPDRGISGVMQLDRHRHFLSILQRYFCGRGAIRLSWHSLPSRSQLLSEETLARCSQKVWGFSQYNSGNREPLFVPGGPAMQILVPWKPVVLVWGLLSGMIFVGFVASSVLQGKDPFAPGHSPHRRKRVLCKRGNTLSTPKNRLALRVNESSELSSC